MGKIHVPPKGELVATIVRDHRVRTFIETGTAKGEASRWGASLFEKVITVEALPNTYEATRAASEGYPNIEFHLGDSGEFLRKLAPTLTEPCLFWLDAHAGGGRFGDKDVCPLLEELAAINTSAPEHFIFVDDARAFTATCPPPFVADVWPSLDQIIPAMVSRHRYHVVLILDTIIAVPQSFKRSLQEFCIKVRPTI